MSSHDTLPPISRKLLPKPTQGTTSVVSEATDAGKSWRRAALGQDYGEYSFRRWTLRWNATPGTYVVAVRATANDGSTQVATPIWNAGGYMRNNIETYAVTVS